MSISAEDTLPDNVWKDSFDRLLDQRPILRALNVIKRDVRASFNMNSSYENSYNDTRFSNLECEEQPSQHNEALILPTSVASKVQYLNIPENIITKKKIQQSKRKVVSTPIKSTKSANPFKCTLSPIGPWNLRHFECNERKETIKNVTKVGFNATPINDNTLGNELIRNLNSPSVEKDIFPHRYSVGVSPLEMVRNKWKSKQSKKKVCFVANKLEDKDVTIPENLNHDVENMSPLLSFKCGLQPGKWRKSLSCLRRLQNPIKVNDTDLKSQKKENQKGRSIGGATRRKSLTTAISVAGKRKSVCLRQSLNYCRTRSRSTYSLGSNDFKRQILQRCGQRRILTFNSAYNECYLRNCCKIGEGAFGEVFVHSKPTNLHVEGENAEKTVLKIIPIEGNELINGEVQKTFEQILPEIIISIELCRLSDENREMNVTSGFVNVQRVRCVYGKYPSYLQKLWEKYDLENVSENDHPKCFTNTQQYIVLELAYGGKDLEGFNFKNAEQSYYALQQIILTLAVGESEYQFEHRDLHWGNILVHNTNQQYRSYKLESNLLTIPTKGIQITIIDYTLSRMSFNEYCFYNDLSNDEELFTATGDYQFEIYRMMRKVLNNKWESFEPKTNIFWISYIISKLIEGVTYKNIQSKNHLYYLGKLKQIQASILTYKSCAEYAQNVLLC